MDGQHEILWAWTPGQRLAVLGQVYHVALNLPLNLRTAAQHVAHPVLAAWLRRRAQEMQQQPSGVAKAWTELGVPAPLPGPVTLAFLERVRAVACSGRAQRMLGVLAALERAGVVDSQEAEAQSPKPNVRSESARPRKAQVRLALPELCAQPDLSCPAGGARLPLLTGAGCAGLEFLATEARADVEAQGEQFLNLYVTMVNAALGSVPAGAAAA